MHDSVNNGIADNIEPFLQFYSKWVRLTLLDLDLDLRGYNEDLEPLENT